MTNYVIRRTFFAILTFFGITILVYWMSTLAPGSPLDSLLADPGMTLRKWNGGRQNLDLTSLSIFSILPGSRNY